jgi:anaerobic selenocysteine-containing dehydrogenase
MRVPVGLHAGVQRDTVWTWNAIGKRRGSWGLAADAPEATRGFLLNHLVSDVLPDAPGSANADPITGQASWFDLRVRIERCEDQRDELAQPQFPALAAEALVGAR